MTTLGGEGKKGERQRWRGSVALTRQAKSPRSSKCRGYSTHVSSLPPTTALALSSSTRPFNPFLKTKRVREGGGVKDSSRLSAHSRCPLVLLGRWSSLLRLRLRVSDMKTVGRLLGTTDGLVKNALALPSATSLLSPLFTVAPPPLPARLSRESVSDLENARYPDRAPGQSSPSNRYPRIHRVHPAFACARRTVVAHTRVSDGNFFMKDVCG